MPIDVTNIALAVATAISAASAAFAWRDARGDRDRKRYKEQIALEVVPLDGRVSALELKFEALLEANAALIETAIIRAVEPLATKLTVLETKMDVFWRQVALDAAKILHQPDPARHRIDCLLEAFMEDTLSADEELELRKELVKIRNWEPGQDLGYPVHPGEQTAAAILLRTMEHATTRRKR